LGRLHSLISPPQAGAITAISARVPSPDELCGVPRKRTDQDARPAAALALACNRKVHRVGNEGRDKRADVRRACAEFLDTASKFYEVPDCGIRVLAARPLRVRESWSTELFGDYTPETMLIRVWMRTAVCKEVTSFGTFLSTLCHEFCHHLDFQKFGFKDSWHTRGFYDRAAALYHHAKGTPPKKLFWVPTSGGRWRIDWPRTNRTAPSSRVG
jgi:hypothetical protein